MKKQTAMALAAVFAMSVAGTALAATANPFVDVPAKHWAYDSINQLAKAGVISGYGDGTYKGDKTLTRYEIATIVAKAMANSDKADAETKKTIEALKAEFSSELSNLGVRVDNLEKNASKVKFTGEVRQRYDWVEKTNNPNLDNTYTTTRLRFNMTAPIDENITFRGRYESQSEFGDGTNNTVKLTQAYIIGKASGLEYRFGRQPLWLGQGLLVDSGGGYDGITLSGGKEVKVKAGALKLGSYNYTIGNIDANLNSKLTLNAAYFKDKDNVNYNTTAAGLSYTGLNDFTITYEYGQNDSDKAKSNNNNNKSKAWYGTIMYAGAKRDKVGSFGIWTGYRNADPGFDPFEYSTPDGGDIGLDDGPWALLDNVKGPEVGVEYTFFRNSRFTLQYDKLELKKYTQGTDRNKKTLTAQMFVYF